MEKKKYYQLVIVDEMGPEIFSTLKNLFAHIAHHELENEHNGESLASVYEISSCEMTQEEYDNLPQQ